MSPHREHHATPMRLLAHPSTGTQKNDTRRKQRIDRTSTFCVQLPVQPSLHHKPLNVALGRRFRPLHVELVRHAVGRAFDKPPSQQQSLDILDVHPDIDLWGLCVVCGAFLRCVRPCGLVCVLVFSVQRPLLWSRIPWTGQHQALYPYHFYPPSSCHAALSFPSPTLRSNSTEKKKENCLGCTTKYYWAETSRM